MNFTHNLASTFLSISIAFLIGTSVSVAHANPAEDIASIKKNLASRTPPVKARSVKLSPISGLYEVFVSGNMIYYVDKNISYVISGGSIIDTTNNKNLTEASFKQLNTIKFGDLPLQNAIEIKKGTGNYKFAVFTDPDCPYCKVLEQELAKAEVTDYTAYVFLFPLKELHPEATEKSESIWCAKDKAESWNNYMIKGARPEKINCVNPITANEKLAEELGVTGTPTIYLNDGTQSQNPQELVVAITGNKK